MKKYDLRKIMKNAWSLRKLTGATMSVALKKAWEMAKATANKFVDGMTIEMDGCVRTLKRWTKYGKDRVYINGGSREGDGYVDIKNNDYCLNGGLTYQLKIAEAVLAMEF